MNMLVTVAPSSGDVGRDDIVVGDVEWPSMTSSLNTGLLELNLPGLSQDQQNQAVNAELARWLD